MVKGYKPRSLAEALQIRSKQEVVPYGGGTDLMIQAQQDKPYLFLDSVPEMKKIYVQDGVLHIGGSCTFTEVLAHADVPQLMKEAVSRIAAPAIRNAGTMAGNIGNGSAKADSVLIDFVADAKLRLASVRGERIVPIAEFYKGRKKLDLAADELIVEILLPAEGLENFYYQKVGGRKALAISRISFAAVLKLKGSRIEDVAIAFGAVSDTVLRFRSLEEKLIGLDTAAARKQKQALLEAYGEKLHLTRGRVSAEYRKSVCLNLLRAFLDEKIGA